MSERILIVDDDIATCRMLEEVFRNEGYEVELALSGAEALEKHRARPCDAVVSDIRMGEGRMTGLEVLKRLKQESPSVVVVIITGFGSMETAIEAIREGAFDYVSKPFKLEEVKLAVRRGLEERRRVAAMRPQAGADSAAAAGPVDVRSLVGRSRPMLEVYKMIAMVAPARTTVLIVGESGTGKELVARAIHQNGPRKEKPFLAINCAALPEPLLESELFGRAGRSRAPSRRSAGSSRRPRGARSFSTRSRTPRSRSSRSSCARSRSRRSGGSGRTRRSRSTCA